MSRAEEARRLREAVAALPGIERVVVERCEFEEQTLAEAAAAAGVSKPWASRLRAQALGRFVGCDERVRPARAPFFRGSARRRMLRA